MVALSDQTAPHAVLFGFEDYVLNVANGVLTAEARQVLLRPKTAAVLAHLLHHAGEVVSREALLDAVWPNLTVTDDSLTQCVSEIRRALGADGARILKTHAKRGYMMATRLRPVVRPPALAEPLAPAAATQPAATAPSRGSRMPRSRLGWAALPVGCGAVALAAIAWMHAERAPPSAPPAAASEAPSSWERARVLLDEGRDAQASAGSREAGLRASLVLFLRALAVEPRLAEAAAEAALVHVNLRNFGVSRDPEQDLREAERLAAVAMAASPEAPLSLGAQAAVLRQQRRFAEALVLYERSARDPRRVADRANVGITHLLLGNPEAAIAALHAALLESPRHSFAGRWRGYLALAHLLAGQPDQAAEVFRTAGGVFPAEEQLLLRLAALHSAGRLAEAEELGTELRRRNPSPRTQSLWALGLSDEAGYLARFEAEVLEPLRRMGWPEPVR